MRFVFFILTAILLVVVSGHPYLILMADAKKIVLKLDLHCDRMKQKAMKAVAGLIGLVSIDVDMKSEKMVLVGSVDPVVVVTKLKKAGLVPKIESFGQAKEPEAKKEEDAKKPEAKNVDLMAEYVKAYYEGRYPYYTQHYRVRSAEDDPNACCVIC